MKIYLFIFLLALIFCNDIGKNEKINLLDSDDEFINEFFSNINNIVINCNSEHDCIFGLLITLFDNLTEEQTEILDDYLNEDDNCRDICASNLSQDAAPFVSEICHYICD